MAIAIVEELWTRIRAAIDDKIVAATAASESAVAAKAAAEAAAIEVQGTVANAATVAAASIVAELQDLTDRAETAATTATTAVVTEVEKLKGEAPEAFDTLGEIAAELAANETERSALTNSIAAKADKVHNHHGDYYTKDQADGQYVSTSGGTIRNGDLNMDGGSVQYIRPDTTGGWARGFWWNDLDYTAIAGIGVFGNADVVEYFYLGHGDEPWYGPVFRAYEDRVSITNLEVTGAVTGIEADDVGAAPASHTHTLDDISGVPNAVSATNVGSTIATRNVDGNLGVSDPTHPIHAANKRYVDGELVKKADTSWVNNVLAPDGNHGGLIADSHLLGSGDAVFDFPSKVSSQVTVRVTGRSSVVGNQALVGYKFRGPNGEKALEGMSGLTYSAAIGEPYRYMYVGAPNVDFTSAYTVTPDPGWTLDGIVIRHWNEGAGNVLVTGVFVDTGLGLRVVTRDLNGGISVPLVPTSNASAVARGYVDQEVGKKANATHTHTAAQISDLTLNPSAVANTVPIRNASGAFSVTEPTSRSHPASRGYVDDRTPDMRVVSSLPASPAAGVVYLVTG